MASIQLDAVAFFGVVEKSNQIWCFHLNRFKQHILMEVVCVLFSFWTACCLWDCKSIHWCWTKQWLAILCQTNTAISVMSVTCYSALRSALGNLWPGCDIFQGGGPSAGSGPNETHRRVITVTGRKLDCWEQQTAEWSTALPLLLLLLFHQLLNRWNDLLAKKVKQKKGMRAKRRGKKFIDRYIEW